MNLEVLGSSISSYSSLFLSNTLLSSVPIILLMASPSSGLASSQHLHWLILANLRWSFSPFSSSQKEVLPSKVNPSPYVLTPITSMQKLLHQTSRLSSLSPTYHMMIFILRAQASPTLVQSKTLLLPPKAPSFSYLFLTSEVSGKLRRGAFTSNFFSLSGALPTAAAPTC